MTDYTVADVSYNQDGEMEQFLLFWDDGEPDTRRATAENILLFDPEDSLPFDGGLNQFFTGDSAVKLNDSPSVVIAQSGDEYSYVLSVDGEPVETTPAQSERILESVYTAIANDDINGLLDMHQSILQNQVRRRIVNLLKQTFDESGRIEITPNGWLVDEFFLVDWNAKMYAANDDTESGDYVRSGGSAVQKDKTYEFVRMNKSFSDIESVHVEIDGEKTSLTEREMLFLAKTRWLLDREHYHPDEAFWTYVNQWATMPSEKPNLDKFSL